MKAILFDYGGTLDVPARHWAHVLWEAYQAYDVPVTEEQFREAYVFAERYLATNPVIAPFDNFNVLLHKKVEIETEELVRLGYWKAKEGKRAAMAESVASYCNDLVINGLDDTRELLADLSERYKLVLVSNFYGNLPTVLEDYGLRSFFPDIVESAVVGVRKPSADIWALGVEAAGCAAGECLAVGDSYGKDIVPADSVGCQTAWLRGETWKPETIDHPVATHVLSSLQDLRTLLL